MQTKARIFYRTSLFVVLTFLALTLPPIGLAQDPAVIATPAPTTAPTPFPVSGPDIDLLPTFEALMVADEDCILPCWWGFQPGETEISEILTLLQDVGFDRYWQRSSLPFTLEEYLRENLPFGLDFISQEIMPIYSFGISFVDQNNRLA